MDEILSINERLQTQQLCETLELYLPDLMLPGSVIKQ